MKLPKHHYIPVFYLREWTGKNKRLVEFSRPTSKEVKARWCGPKGTAYVRGLYRLEHLPGDAAEVFERLFFAQVDNLAKDSLDIMLRRKPWKWNDKTRSAWSRFVVGILFRNPERIMATRQYIEDLALDNYEVDRLTYEAQKKDGDPDFLEYVIRFVAFNAIDWTKSIIANSQISQHLNNMRWSVRDVSDAGLKLFTSDRPIVMSNGLAYDHSHIVMPISPTKAFVACNTAETERELLSMQSIQFIRNSNAQILRYAQKLAWNTGDEQINTADKFLSIEAGADRAFFEAPPYRRPQSNEPPQV